MIKACQVALGPSFFSRDQLKVSVRTRNASCKVFLGKTIRHHLRIPHMTRKPFLEYLYNSCFRQNTIQNMKNIQLFLDVVVLVLLIHLYRPGENL